MTDAGADELAAVLGGTAITDLGLEANGIGEASAATLSAALPHATQAAPLPAVWLQCLSMVQWHGLPQAPPASGMPTSITILELAPDQAN